MPRVNYPSDQRLSIMPLFSFVPLERQLKKLSEIDGQTYLIYAPFFIVPHDGYRRQYVSDSLTVHSLRRSSHRPTKSSLCMLSSGDHCGRMLSLSNLSSVRPVHPPSLSWRAHASCTNRSVSTETGIQGVGSQSKKSFTSRAAASSIICPTAEFRG
jgi:hypothetical protein